MHIINKILRIEDMQKQNGFLSCSRTAVLHLLLVIMLLLYIQTCKAAPSIDTLTDVGSSKVAHVRVLGDELRRLPDTFFGFNLEYLPFQRDLFDSAQRRAKSDALHYFKEMPGSVYRYPGGLISNHFNWEWAVGDPKQRPSQRAVNWHAPVPVDFGPDEYFSFLDEVGGIPWYTLNLVGWSPTEMVNELPSATLAASNQRLAQYLRTRMGAKPVTRYYHLGNELDRNIYRWPPEKYIQRARDTIEAIRKVDPDARFVAFLRDFNLTFGPRFGRNTYQYHMREVLTALPMVDDYSFQYYYDYPADDLGKNSPIPVRLAMFKKAIQYATEVRGGKSPRVWISEHGRSRHPEKKGPTAYKFTNGLGGAISAADFWVAVAQIPAIQGAFLHTGGQWSLFEDTGKELIPMPLYWAVRLLRDTRLPIVLSTQNRSPNVSEYMGGYDMRAVVFTDEARQQYGLWMVNRSSQPTHVTVEIPELAGAKLTMRHGFVAGRAGISADNDPKPPAIVLDPPPQDRQVDKKGMLTLELPANSVSGFRLTRE